MQNSMAKFNLLQPSQFFRLTLISPRLFSLSSFSDSQCDSVTVVPRKCNKARLRCPANKCIVLENGEIFFLLLMYFLIEILDNF